MRPANKWRINRVDGIDWIRRVPMNFNEFDLIELDDPERLGRTAVRPYAPMDLNGFIWM